MYEVHTALKALIKSAGLTVRDVAVVYNMTPTSLSNKLNGYAPLDKTLSDKIERICKVQVKRIMAAEKEREKKVVFSPRPKRSILTSLEAREYADAEE